MYNDYIFVQPSFLQGVARVFDLGGSLSRGSFLMSRTPLEADNRALASDWCNVGRDLNEALTTVTTTARPPKGASAERQGEHRQRMEWIFLRFNGVSQVLGVIFAGLAILGGIGGGIFLLYHDKNLSGFGALLTPLATVGSIFLLERKSHRRF